MHLAFLATPEMARATEGEEPGEEVQSMLLSGRGEWKCDAGREARGLSSQPIPMPAHNVRTC